MSPKKRIEKRPDVGALAAGMVMFSSGIAVLVFPMVVPFRVSIWNAFSSRLSQMFPAHWSNRCHTRGPRLIILCPLDISR